MYRILILIVGFLIALGGLLFLQGGERDPRDLAQVSPNLAEVPVTGVEQMSAPTAAASVASGLDMSALTAAVQASVEPQAVPAQAAGDELSNMTSGVLAELGVAAPANAEEAQMAEITNAVLASLNGGVAPTQAEAKLGLKDLIAQSMRSGQGDAYIDALLSEAVTSGGVAVPQALKNADGSLDTRSLLASIVDQSMGTAGGSDVAAIAAEAGGGATVSSKAVVAQVAAPAAQTTSGGQRVYVVEPGDSLAYISLIFYKDTRFYSRIYEANRGTLSSPDHIRVGQKLVIPG